MLRRVLPVSAVAFMLLTGGCSADNGDEEKAEKAEKAEKVDTVAAERATCEELFGGAGVKWLENGTRGAGKLSLQSAHDLKATRSLLRSQIEKWRPSTDGVQLFMAAKDVCSAGVVGGGREPAVTVDFRPSILPFDAPVGKGNLTETPVNSDVRLLIREEDAGSVMYVAFVTCKLPGTQARQEKAVPIEADMRDSLTGDESARTHFTHLLHAARVVVGGLDCRNKPVIPAEPPASVT